MVFRWCLRDSKSPQDSTTLLSILVDLSNAVVWMVSTLPAISKSSSPLTNPLVTVQRAPITVGINVTCMFQSFFQFPSKVQVLTLLSIFLQLYSVVIRDSKFDNSASSFFVVVVDYYKVWPRLGDPFLWQNPIGVCASHSPRGILGCAYIIFSYGQM